MLESKIGELKDAILRVVREAREQYPEITDEEAVVAVQVAGIALEREVFGARGMGRPSSNVEILRELGEGTNGVRR